MERKVTWIDETYTCVLVRELADYGYFDYNEISDISDKIIKLTRNSNTLVIDSVKYVDICE